MLETSASILHGSLGGESSRTKSAPSAAHEPLAPHSSETESQEVAEELEFARIETLLALRARSLDTLQREFDRRDRRLREALERLATTSSDELVALRQGHEAAVKQALEAELARAELGFALDETRAQLTAAPGSRVAAPPAASPSVNGALAHGAHTAPITHGVHVAHAETPRAPSRDEALRGERAGLVARLSETEQAFRSAEQRYGDLARRHDDTEARLLEARTESAELAVLAHARETRISELTQALAREQREVRDLRSQLAAVLAEQAAQSEASEDFLLSLEAPLRELDHSLQQLRPEPGPRDAALGAL
ncbi:MAG: hypothetical protein ABW321_23855, partial [Polyangiales bacterium]